MFNLGFMHEFGVGVPKDLHLARKFYSMAQHTQVDGACDPWRRGACVHEWWEHESSNAIAESPVALAATGAPTTIPAAGHCCACFCSRIQ